MTLKMVVMEDLTAESINKKVGKLVDKSASVLTDGYKGYSKLKEKIAHHQVVVSLTRQNQQKYFLG